MLWAGEDTALHSSLIEKLQTAGIPFIDKSAGDDRTVPSADIIPIDWKARFGFEVAVPSSSLAEAEKILEELLNEEPADMEIAENDSLEPTIAEREPSKVGAAICAVWSGSDEARAGFLVQALNENEIPARVETHGSEATVYVPPEEEMLAREIIREIVEGAPPK
jgi:hypothetical protein